MIEVLMLLAFFATNILKPISKVLEDYDGFMSLAELIIEGLFLFFVLKESKMTKKSFEWMEAEQKEKREKDIAKKINYFAWFVVRGFTNIYKELLDKKDNRKIYSIIFKSDAEIIKQICEDIAKKSFLPIPFCEEIIKSSITTLQGQFRIGEIIDYNVVYDYFFEWANRIFTTEVLTPSFINQCKKHFKSDKEIDAIYKKLINNKL